MLRILWQSARSAFSSPRLLPRRLRQALRIFVAEGYEGLAARSLQPAAFVISRRKYEAWIARHDRLTPGDREAIGRRIATLASTPQISIVMPVHDPPETHLRRALDSVLAQLYPHWELCVADDASSNPRIRRILEDYKDRDDRIRLTLREHRGHICAAANTALDMVSGELVAFLDHDDVLAEHALYMVAEEWNDHPEAALIYCDEDKIDSRRRRFDPFFKPDWSPDLFYSQNFVNHLSVLRTSLVREVGGFRSGYEGSQDYDLLLRCLEKIEPAQIRHIPFVLYHWGVHASSTAAIPQAKPYAIDSARAAIRSHFLRQGQTVEVTTSLLPIYHRVHYPLSEPPPLVSLVLCAEEGEGFGSLRRRIERLRSQTAYANLELLLVTSQEGKLEPTDLRHERWAGQQVEVLAFSQGLGPAAVQNNAAQRCRGTVIVFVGRAVSPETPEWLAEMVAHALQPKVGAVGARLYARNHRVRHAGIVLGIGGTASAVNGGLGGWSAGPFGRALLIGNFSAVSGACLAVRRELFEKVGGFDDRNLPTAFYDIDLCLRLGERGYRVVWTPHAELLQREAQEWEQTGRAREAVGGEPAYMRSRWADRLANDPFYNPNLSLAPSRQFDLETPPRVRKPWLAVGAGSG